MIKKNSRLRSGSKLTNKKGARSTVRSVKSPYKMSRRSGLKKAVAKSQANLPKWFWAI